ncbi:hypothetical protein AC578_3143 [Pseudocercospora eumusae]|uniref:SCP domain-containing protein n=1 Tax=Pseudocercospora eumusae TaxID=321146 RepID=A0A139HDV4_9PEZI|nr:hypothetical protein AC578_3143 [Pseudocercospora eumusae]
MHFVVAIAALAASVSALPFLDGEAVSGTPVYHESPAELLKRDLSYKQRAVLQHNLHRANHSVGNVSWDSNLANWAKQLAERCVFAHDVTIGSDTAAFQATNGYGQNIAAGVKGDNITMVINDLWYGSEINWFGDMYGQADPDMTNFHEWGHFTQVVWADSVKIGCSTVQCNRTITNTGSDVWPYMTVCNYSPPGNYQGEFDKNVKRPLGQPSASWNTGLS